MLHSRRSLHGIGLLAVGWEMVVGRQAASWEMVVGRQAASWEMVVGRQAVSWEMVANWLGDGYWLSVGDVVG